MTTRLSRAARGALLALALTAAACTNQSPQSAAAGGPGQDATAGSGNDGHLRVAVISHSKPGDAFWDVVKSGAEQAGADLDVTVSYSGDDSPVAQSQLVDNAVAQRVDGIVVSLANPDGLRDSVRKAQAAGIPVITMNSGIEVSHELGAITHVGQSEDLAGEAAGAEFARLGSSKLLCVIHESGNLGQESRCQGAKTGFDAGGPGKTVENIQVDISNIADAQSTIRATLSADPSIDGVLTLNSAVGVVALQARTEARGRDAAATTPIGTFDLDSNVIAAIRSKQLAFAVDQQPYLQGYLPVVMLALKARNGNDVGGGQPVYSGPTLITSANVEQVAGFAEKGTR